MKFQPLCLLAAGTLACATLVAAGPAALRAQTSVSRFAMLPLVVGGDTTLPYAVNPTVAERTKLGTSLQSRIAQMKGGTPVASRRVAAALGAAGYDQNSTYRQCDTAECARKVGKTLHVDTVVFGSVTRAMAVIWGTEVSLVDVASGKVQGPYSLGYKGDFVTLSTAVPTLAKAVSAQLIADANERKRAMAFSHH